jgi:L-2-hydroxyglutarate oxidase
LFVPQTGIVDYTAVTEKYGELLRNAGDTIITGAKFISVTADGKSLKLKTTAGDINCRFLVNCGGLYSDQIARICGVDPQLRIVPFRGEYYRLNEGKEYLIRNLLYPVPDPEFPFLGVHFTRMIKGGVEAGPNAVLAFKREGYRKKDISIGEMYDLVLFRGFRIMAAKYYKMGFEEFYRSFSKKAFVKALQKLVPEINLDDLRPGGAGVRAQALDNDGKLIDDFRIIEAESMVHVLNAPSPAATASLSIGMKISQIVSQKISAA